MAKVFLSHASADIELALTVHRWLADGKHTVFQHQHPRDGIPLGEEWEQQLYEQLRHADAVVCVVTSAFLTSTWCAAEVGIARSLGSRLLPLCAEPGVAHPLLRSTQHIDLAPDQAAAQAALAAALRRVETTWSDKHSPFPGLQPFDAERHRVFFGRTEEIEQLAEVLRSPAERAKGAVLLIVGPSGCGKSSLVRAGLLPVIATEPGWRALPPILPGTDPIGELARELARAARQAGLGWTMDHVRRHLHEHGLTGLADELLLADPTGPQRRLLIVVDQFEELLTQTPPVERARFAALLRPALTGPVQVVATLRPEFLDQFLSDTELIALPAHTYPLRPLHREALRAVIENPCELAGIDVEDHLVDRLVEDTDSGDALPLLAFTLAQLADGIHRGGQLPVARYDQLGGVQGALTRQADEALIAGIAAGGRSREQVISGLLRLVTVDEQGRPTRWRAIRGELPTPVVAELDEFVTRRLLTTAQDTDNGPVFVGAAHEAFLSAWPPLAKAIADNVSALRARRAVEHAAMEWNTKHRPPTRLWGGGQLAAAVTDTGARISTGDAPPPRRKGPPRWLPRRHRVVVTDRVDLSPQARDFLYASIRRDRYRRRRATTVLSVLLILALLGAGFAVFQERIAQERRLEATAHELVAQAEATRGTDLHTALLLGMAAHRIHPDGETQLGLVNTLTAGSYASTLTGHTGGVKSVAFAPDDRALATGSEDGTAILWDLTDQPRQLAPPLTGHNNTVNSVTFAPDGRTLATGSDDGTAILWDLTNLTQPHQLGPPLTGHTDAVNSVAFTPDGRTLATGSTDGTAILWDLTNPTQPHPTPPTRTSPDRPHRRGELRSTRPRRPHPGHRQQRRHRDPVGPHQPHPTPPTWPTPDRPHQ